MILSTQTDVSAQKLGIEASVRMIAEAGFDAVDLSMFENESTNWIYEDGYAEKARALADFAHGLGVFFNQAHAPFPSFRVNDEAYNARIRPMLLRAIETAGIVGAKKIVVHPVAFPLNKKENNMRMYNELLPAAKSAGVKIALENMWGYDSRSGVIVPNVCSVAEELADYADSLDPEWFTVCLDIGHIGLVHEYEAPFIRTLGGKRLTCVHIHDNDYIHDSHTCPFTGQLPWHEIAAAFAQIGYRGDITLEADNFLARNLPVSLYPAGLRFMEAAGRELIRMIEEEASE